MCHSIFSTKVFRYIILQHLTLNMLKSLCHAEWYRTLRLDPIELATSVPLKLYVLFSLHICYFHKRFIALLTLLPLRKILVAFYILISIYLNFFFVGSLKKCSCQQ